LSSQKITGTLQKINYYLERLLPITTPLSIVIGFLLSSFFIQLRPLVPWLFGLITFSGVLKLKAAELGAAIRSPLPIILCFAAAHVLMPVIAMFVSSVFFINPDIVAGFILLFSGPTAISGFIWVSILRGDIALCLTFILLDTLLAPLVVPGSVSILMGAKVAMDMGGIAISLLFMIVIPTIIGVTINETSKGKLSAFICPYLDILAKISLMTVIATNASIIAPGVRIDDPLMWKIAALVIALIIFSFFLMKLVAVLGKCRPPKDIAMIISGALRNNTAVMTIAVAFFPEAVVLPALLSIIFQQSIAAIMGRFFTRQNKENKDGKK